MKLDEIYNIDEEWDKIDMRFNREGYEFKNKETERYTEIANKSKGETPVFINEPAEEKHWSNNPHHDEEKDKRQSPGFRGEQVAKKGAGVPYKKFNKWEDELFPQPNSI